MVPKNIIINCILDTMPEINQQEKENSWLIENFKKQPGMIEKMIKDNLNQITTWVSKNGIEISPDDLDPEIFSSAFFIALEEKIFAKN